MMIRNVILIAFLTFCTAATATAQRVEEYVSRLNDSPQGASAKVYLSPAVQRAVRGNFATEKVAGFRVCVFSDNSQNARSAATAALGMLGSMIGTGQVNMIYDNPFFRVYGGYCINKTEAAQLMGRVRGAFPRAFILPMSIPVANFAVSPAVPSASDSTQLIPPSMLNQLEFE